MRWIAAVMKIVWPSVKPKKKAMITANDRIGDAPKISGSRPAYRDQAHGAIIAAVRWLGNHLELGG